MSPGSSPDSLKTSLPPVIDRRDSRSVAGAFGFPEAARPSTGNYQIDIVVRDVVGGKTGSHKQGFAVPRYPEGELSSSSLILATKLEPLTGGCRPGSSCSAS